jgi:peroxiredoxin
MKKAGLMILVALIAFSCNAQKYEIKVKINGVSDTLVYLGHHFGEKKYVIDTARIDSKGYAVFTGEKDINRGIYLLVMPSKGMTYFEFLIGASKKFSIETDTANFVENMKIKGCKENLIFNEYQKRMSEIQKERVELNKLYEAAKDNPEEQKRISDLMVTQNKERVAYMDKLIADNPGTFFSKILLSMKEVDIPEAPKDENGVQIEADFQYKYYKAHYWDYISWDESGLLRTPIFEGKINYYFDKMVVPTPDSMMPEARKLITRAYEGGDSLMYQFTASHLLHYFEASKIMGYDAVFVDIAEQWYLSGKAYWADSTFMTKLVDRVNKITPTKLGNIATDLKRMQTVDEKYVTLSQVDADYTVLVFYEPSCGHCKKEVPILMQHFRDSLQAMNVNVFALYTQYDRPEWEEFVKDKDLTADGWYNVWDGPYPHSGFRDFYDIYSTPVVYVLDRDKKIIGKRIGMENIKSLIEFENKRKEREQPK